MKLTMTTTALFGALLLLAGGGGGNGGGVGVGVGVVNGQTLNDVVTVGLGIPEFSLDDIPVFSGQSYIIWLDQELVDDIKSAINSIVPTEYRSYINHIFVNLNGFSVKGLPEEVLQALETSEFVTSVTQAQPVAIPPPEETSADELAAIGDAIPDDTGSRRRLLTKNRNRNLAGGRVPTGDDLLWNLDRIDQESLPLNGVYQYANEGSGQHIYVLDTGIKGTHNAIKDNLVECIDITSSRVLSPANCQDRNGHGTHVAGTAVGLPFGIATQAWLHSVKIMADDGSGTSDDMIAGMEYVRARCASEKPIVNMSFGGQKDTILEQLVHLMEAEGCTVVVAAGNSNVNACNQSPGGAAAAVTVGATNYVDEKSDFSNFGSCVDVYAPGSGINSASNVGDDNASQVLSGTSMAAPLVSGIMALYKEKGWNAYDFLSASITGKISGISSSEENNLATVIPVLEGTRPESIFTLGDSCTASDGSAGTIAYLDIFTDGFPGEIGWDLQKDNGDVLERKAAGSYTAEGTFFEEFLCVPNGQNVRLTMTDGGGDGLCCGFGMGSYKFTVGSFDNPPAYGSVYTTSSIAEPRGPISGAPANPRPPTPPATVTPASGAFNDRCSSSTVSNGYYAIMDVLTDLFPLETSWELTDARGTTVIDSREAGFYTVPSQLYREAICVPASGELALIVYDSKDDGVCCGGNGNGGLKFTIDAASNFYAVREFQNKADFRVQRVQRDGGGVQSVGGGGGSSGGNSFVVQASGSLLAIVSSFATLWLFW